MAVNGLCQLILLMQDTELALLIDRFMRRIHFSLQSKAHSFDTSNVGPGGGIVLLTLAEMGRPSLHELTTRVARDKSQMTRTIKSLESKGLVERNSSEHDARVGLVTVTKLGESVVEDLRVALAETIDEILDPITDTEKTELKDLMKRVVG